jgi:hypothetical protein
MAARVRSPKQHLVARAVTVHVVRPLELIDVQQRHAERGSRRFMRSASMCNAGLQGQPVERRLRVGVQQARPLSRRGSRESDSDMVDQSMIPAAVQMRDVRRRRNAPFLTVPGIARRAIPDSGGRSTSNGPPERDG